MQNQKLANSLKSLVNLYTVVIGAALSLAVVAVIDPTSGLASVTAPALLLFFAFLATLIPFFHGALRHLDDAYLENTGNHAKNGALIVDYALLFIHGLGFLVLALLLKNPAHFAWVLAAILMIDVIWGGFAFFVSASEDSAVPRWTLINLIFVAGLVVFLAYHRLWPTLSNEAAPDRPWSDPVLIALVLFFACLIRTTIDYAWCRDFYFPNRKK